MLELPYSMRLARLCTTLPLGMVIAFGFALTSALGQVEASSQAQAEEAAAQKLDKKSGKNSELTEGLLDLLNEPPTVKSMPANNKGTALTPADVGLDGEDLGELSANPLKSVKQSMVIAAGYLKQGTADEQTQQLQQDIVQRLDELIAQFEKSNPPRKPSSPGPQEDKGNQQQSEQQNQQQNQRGNQQQDSAESSQMTENESQRTEVQENGTGQGESNINVVVDLADPRALQQNVWGHLPERLRTQMQSRMVEQFLPSYREQIEAYFKALLEQER